jgi:hypothetical protein
MPVSDDIRATLAGVLALVAAVDLARRVLVPPFVR